MLSTPALLAAALLAAPAEPSPTDGCPGVMVFFASDSTRLDAEAQAMLDGSWTWLGDMIAAGAWINVSGHTDDVGTASYNLRLSRRRAEAVRLYYLHRGVRPDQIRITAFGETHPIAELGERHSNAVVRATNRNVNASPEMPIAIFHRFFPPGEPIC